MQPISYRTMNSGEEQAVCYLIKQVFNEFVAPDYSKAGIEEFFRFANPSAMEERMQSDGFILVAYHDDEIVGMLEFRPPDHIALFFVSAPNHGIGKELLAHSIDKACAINPALSKLTVHSSPYAEPIYLKMGFHKVGGVTTDHGITYVPMELLFKKDIDLHI